MALWPIYGFLPVRLYKTEIVRGRGSNRERERDRETDAAKVGVVAIRWCNRRERQSETKWRTQRGVISSHILRGGEGIVEGAARERERRGGLEVLCQ